MKKVPLFSVGPKMGLDGKVKWEKRIIGPVLVQSTLSGSFGPNFGFWALKENCYLFLVT